MHGLGGECNACVWWDGVACGEVEGSYSYSHVGDCSMLVDSWRTEKEITY